MNMNRQTHAHREKNNDILKMCVNLEDLIVQEASGAVKSFWVFATMLILERFVF